MENFENDSSKGSDGLHTKAAARVLGITEGTLAVWRYQKRGPIYYKVGGKKVVYRHADLERYLVSCAVTPSENNRAA